MCKMLSVLAVVMLLAMPAVASAHPVAICKVPVAVTGGAAGPIVPFLTFTGLGFAAVYLIAENYQFPTVYLGLTSYYGETDFPSGRS